MKPITQRRVEWLARHMYTVSASRLLAQAPDTIVSPWNKHRKAGKALWMMAARAALELLAEDFQAEYAAGRLEGMRQSAQADGRSEDAHDLEKLL